MVACGDPLGGPKTRALVEARDQRELGRLQRRLDRVELLILDEIGFVPFDRTGGEMLFNAIAARYERRSVLVTLGDHLKTGHS